MVFFCCIFIVILLRYNTVESCGGAFTEEKRSKLRSPSALPTCTQQVLLKWGVLTISCF